MADTIVTVQSIAPAAGYPVAVTIETIGGGSAATQWVQARSSGQFIGLTVASVVGQVAVAVTSLSAPIQGSVWVSNSPLQVAPGSTGTFQGFTVSSVVGTVGVVASVQGIPAVTGSVWVSNSPLVVRAGSTGDPQGFTVASVIGTVAVVASMQGIATVYVASQGGGGSTITGSVWIANSPVPVQPGSTGAFAGFNVSSIIGIPTVYVASQGGGGSVVQGSVWVSNSPLIVQPGSTGAFTGLTVTSVIGIPTVYVASQGGGGSTITGSVWIVNSPVPVTGSITTIVNSGLGVVVVSPLPVLPGSTGAFQGFTVASVIGIPTVYVASQGGGGSTITGSVFAAQVGSWEIDGQAGVIDTRNSTLVALNSGATFVGSWFDLLNYAGAILNVAVDRAGTVQLEYSIDATSIDYVAVQPIAGSGFATFNVTPNARYYQLRYTNTSGTQGWFRVQAIAKPIGFQPSAVGVTQVDSPWAVTGSVAALVSSGLGVVVGSPLPVLPGSTGAFQGFTVASVIGIPTVYVASQGGGGSVIQGSVWVSNSPLVTQPGSTGAFQGFVVSSVIGIPTVYVASQGGGGSTIQGSVWVSNSPLVTQPGSTGAFQGFTVTSLIGIPTVYVASQGGGGSVIQGSVFATQAGSWEVVVNSTAVIGSVWMTNSIVLVQVQSGNQTLGSIRVAGTLGHDVAGALNPVVVGGFATPYSLEPPAVQSGDVTFLRADVEGRLRVRVESSLIMTVTSVIGIPTVYVASQGGGGSTITGSVWVSNSPLVTQPGSTGAFMGFTVTSVIGIPTVYVASQGGGGSTITGSVWVSNSPLPVSIASGGAAIGIVQAHGTAAHDTAANSINPVLAGGYVTPYSASPPAANSGDTTFLRADAEGRLRVRVESSAVGLYGVPTSYFSWNSSGTGATTSADFLVASAAPSGLRWYVSAIMVTVQSVGTIVELKDTTRTLWRGYCPPGGGGYAPVFTTPIPVTVAGSVMAGCMTSGAAALVSIAGFLG